LTPESKADLILVDAKYLLWRAVMGNPEEPVGLWFHYFLKAKAAHLAPGGKMIVCWDDDQRTTQRRKWFPDYKRSRGENRAYEAARIAKNAKIDIIKALSFTTIEQTLAPEWEADDVIGTLIKQRRNREETIFIFSADRDFYQVLTPDVYLMNVKGEKYTFVDGAEAEEKMGVPVKRMILLKALAGDSSDGVPGVRGIGPKKAAKLLLKHDYNLKACAVELDVDYHLIKLYRSLVRIKTTADIEWTTGKRKPKELLAYLLSIGAKSMLQGHKYRGLYD
jgi:DNA polymerase-1